MTTRVQTGLHSLASSIGSQVNSVDALESRVAETSAYAWRALPLPLAQSRRGAVG
jgi:hypothetical protein